VFRRLVGKLIYLTITRPDVSFALQVLSQFMHDPTEAHLAVAKHVLRYLRSTLDQGILLSKCADISLIGFCDSNWGSCCDFRKYTIGFCILLGSSPISRKVKKQSVVACSSAEAEYRAMASTCCEIVWLLALLKDLGLTNLTPVILFSDNQVALHISANPVFHERIKYIEVDCHYIRDQLTAKRIQPTYVSSHEQLADIFANLYQSHSISIYSASWVFAVPFNTQLEGECRIICCIFRDIEKKNASCASVGCYGD